MASAPAGTSCLHPRPVVSDVISRETTQRSLGLLPLGKPQTMKMFGHSKLETGPRRSSPLVEVSLQGMPSHALAGSSPV